jgi:hypothetical protein
MQSVSDRQLPSHRVGGAHSRGLEEMQAGLDLFDQTLARIIALTRTFI